MSELTKERAILTIDSLVKQFGNEDDKAAFDGIKNSIERLTDELTKSNRAVDRLIEKEVPNKCPEALIECRIGDSCIACWRKWAFGAEE